MPWQRAVLVWMLFILVETLHGILREIFIAPVLGDLRARQLGTPVACAIVFFVAWLTARWVNASTRHQQLAVGALWVALTLVFEVVLGRALGLTWARLFADYNPARGGLMLLALTFTFFVPMLVARLRKRRPPLITHLGGCHCGRVRFEVDAPAELSIDDCNCSVCARLGFLHLIVAADRFRITQGKDALTTYTFNTGTAKHLFCATCGIKPFYVPRSHPDGFSVNARCIDSATVTGMKVTPIDGRNWEQQYPEGRGEFTA